MNCYRLYLEEKAQAVRRGEDLKKLSFNEIILLEEYALDIRDLELYDKLNDYLNASK